MGHRFVKWKSHIHNRVVGELNKYILNPYHTAVVFTTQ